MATVPHPPFEITTDRPLAPWEYAALDVASRPLAKVRKDLDVGDYKVFSKLLISGSLTVRPSVHVSTQADVLGVLAWILARLPDKGRSAVAAAIASGDTLMVGKAERDAARALCEPTKGSTVRSGAITGTIDVEILG